MSDTKHSDIDPAGVQKRTATRQVEQQDRLDHIEPIVMVLDARTLRMEEMLKVALAPKMVHPSVQGVFAVAAVVWTVCLVLVALSVAHPAPARASMSPTIETVSR